MAWNYNPNDYQEKTYSVIPMGDHRVRIAAVEFVTFRSGNEGYKFTFDVSGHGGKLFTNFVLDASNPKLTNQRIGEFFDCFGITDHTMGDGYQWVGRTGAVRVKHEDYDGKLQARVSYYIQRDRQDKLEPWKEPGGSTASAPANSWTTAEIPQGW